MIIPNTFKVEDADYITLPALRTFCYENGLDTTKNRQEIIRDVEKFASDNNNNCCITQEWLNSVLKIGIKTCSMYRIYPKITDRSVISQIIRTKFPSYVKKNICDCRPTKEIELINYNINYDDNNNVTFSSFIFIIKLVKAVDSYSNVGTTVFYPIFVDVDYMNNFTICRSKSISGIFKISNNTEIDPKKRTSPESLMSECEKIVSSIFSYTKEELTISKSAFKRTIFNVLNEYTATPVEIQKCIDDTKEDCENFRQALFNKLSLIVNEENINDAQYDLQIFVEKYASITHPDETIFTKDRKAFPVKFNAQDNEFTKIQETSSGSEDPLQRKKAFFDSKKSVYTDKKCDKICLCHQREPKRYFGDKPFNVQIYYDKGACMVKFLKFVEEDDIQNVLSRIIQLYNIQD